MSGRNGGGGRRPADTDMPSAEGRPLATVTLDGSIFDVRKLAARSMGGATTRSAARGKPQGGAQPAPQRSSWGNPQHAQRLPSTSVGTSGRQSMQPKRISNTVHLDKGEAEASFISALRGHYTRNGTAESFGPKFKSTPHKAYSGSNGGSAPPGCSPVGPVRLERQEQELWEEREEELLDAQERRFAQLEDAMVAREAKREAYLVHRLEATAAEKIQEHRRRQEAVARERQLAAQHAQHLPSLKQAHAATLPPAHASSLRKLAGHPLFPASASLVAAVGQAAASISSLSGISTLQAGLKSRQACSPSALGGASLKAHGGLPPLGSRRPSWREKRQAKATVLVDEVYAQIKATRASGGRLLSPLDAAKVASRKGVLAAAPVPPANDPSTAHSLEQDMEGHAAVYEAHLVAEQSEDAAAQDLGSTRTGNIAIQAGSPREGNEAAGGPDEQAEEPVDSPGGLQAAGSVAADQEGADTETRPELQLDVEPGAEVEAEAVDEQGEAAPQSAAGEAKEAPPTVAAEADAREAVASEAEAAGTAEYGAEEQEAVEAEAVADVDADGAVAEWVAERADPIDARQAPHAAEAGCCGGSRASSPPWAPSAEGSSLWAGDAGIVVAEKSRCSSTSSFAEAPSEESSNPSTNAGASYWIPAVQLVAAGATEVPACAVMQLGWPHAGPAEEEAFPVIVPPLRLALMPEEIAAFEMDKAMLLAARPAAPAAAAQEEKEGEAGDLVTAPRLPLAERAGEAVVAAQEPLLVDGAPARSLAEEVTAPAQPVCLTLLPEEIAAFVVNQGAPAAPEAQEGAEVTVPQLPVVASISTGETSLPAAGEAAAEPTAMVPLLVPDSASEEEGEEVVSAPLPPPQLLPGERAPAEVALAVPLLLSPEQEEEQSHEVASAPPSQLLADKNALRSPTEDALAVLLLLGQQEEDLKEEVASASPPASYQELQAKVPATQLKSAPAPTEAAHGSNTAEEVEQAELQLMQDSLLEYAAEGLSQLPPATSVGASDASMDCAAIGQAEAAAPLPANSESHSDAGMLTEGAKAAHEDSFKAAADASDTAAWAQEQGELHNTPAVARADTVEKVQLMAHASASLMFGGDFEVTVWEEAEQERCAVDAQQVDATGTQNAAPADAEAAAQANVELEEEVILEVEASMASAASSGASSGWAVGGDGSNKQQDEGEVVPAQDLFSDLARPAMAGDSAGGSYEQQDAGDMITFLDLFADLARTTAEAARGSCRGSEAGQVGHAAEHGDTELQLVAGDSGETGNREWRILDTL